MEDTIAAISTPLGVGGIAIVRMSGSHAFDVADAVFHSSQGKPSTFASHTIHHGKIIEAGEIVDEVMLSILRAPRTYTTEDTIEINCHGGLVTAQRILALCLRNGARMADPGEFTKRAFLNGRLDLTQAEAVMDLISAKTQRAQAAAMQALEGKLYRHIEAIRQRIITILAHIEAHLDFSEEDIELATRESLYADIEQCIQAAQKLSETARSGRILREGILIAIVGRPNVGKSSLMNALVGRDRSIVTHIPGTTRDSVEELITIHGFPIRLTDTAGYRRKCGTIEGFGINRMHKVLSEAEIVIHVVDASRKFSVLDLEILSFCKTKSVVQVFNKADLKTLIIPPLEWHHYKRINMSAVTGFGLDSLKNEILKCISNKSCITSTSEVFINERHNNLLTRIIWFLNRTKKSILNDTGFEIIAHDMRQALLLSGEITGHIINEDVLDRLFESFCIGK
jgi:tRNA modification GTPase